MAEQEVQIFRRLGKIVQTKLSVGYEAEQKGLEKTIQELSEQIAQKTDKTISIDRFMKLVKKNTHLEELTPTLFNTFTEKIFVHEIEVDAGRKRSQKIDAYAAQKVQLDRR